jgi:hypothetical protein
MFVSASGNCGTIEILEGNERVALVCSDWTELEACVVQLRSDKDRPEVTKLLKGYWPRLTVVWPEDLTVIPVGPSRFSTRPLK